MARRPASPDTLRAQINEALLAAIDKAGTQEAFAQSLGVDPSTVSRWKKRGLNAKAARTLDKASIKVGRSTFPELMRQLEELEGTASGHRGKATSLFLPTQPTFARIPLAGIWFQGVPEHPSRPYASIDRVEVTQAHDRVSGRIRRLEPSKDTGFEWQFEGQVREETFLFVIFWSTSEQNPSSNGVIALERAGHRREHFEGLYVRHRFELAEPRLMPVPLWWNRTKATPRERDFRSEGSISLED